MSYCQPGSFDQGLGAEHADLALDECFALQTVTQVGQQRGNAYHVAGAEYLEQDAFVLAVDGGEPGDAREHDVDGIARLPAVIDDRALAKAANSKLLAQA